MRVRSNPRPNEIDVGGSALATGCKDDMDEAMDSSFGGRVRNQKDPEYRQRRIHSKVHDADPKQGIGTPAANRLKNMNLGDNEEDLEDEED
jgi:hypothetical protein